MSTGNKKPSTRDNVEKLTSPEIYADIRRMIEETRSAVAIAVNAGLTILHWRVGKRLREEVLHCERAKYGKEIVQALSAQLTAEYGRGWSKRNLAYMIRFAEVFSDEQILHTLCAKLSWSHFRKVIYLDDSLKRDFYTEMCRIENWSTRTLQKKIDSRAQGQTRTIDWEHYSARRAKTPRQGKAIRHLLRNCEWDRDDYSLEVSALPAAPTPEEEAAKRIEELPLFAKGEKE